MFATARTGGANSGTGLHMAGHHNLTTQLVMTLNGLCGRYDRPGGMNRTEGALGRSFDSSMEAVPLASPPKSRIRGIAALNGLFGNYFEMPPTTLASGEVLEFESDLDFVISGDSPSKPRRSGVSNDPSSGRTSGQRRF